ncbi:expressed unknown protein [Seminavis robusta]|uniref:Uncharacterized protein n=1 Tax=Seminavis robusta TaxID=568900 RepID=A0A9N8EPT3_9STRA|nr:expressed unknown protein [Seminavis robusta]|eukprot:Sro1361_g266190.1 n/a (187) ;mRNA; f:9350-9910
MDMDQFMTDFLEGKYLDDQPGAPTLKRHSSASNSKAREEPNSRGIRRTKTSDASGQPRRAVPRRTKSGDEMVTLRRTKTGEGATRRVSRMSPVPSRRSSRSPGPRRKSSKDQEQMDPQAVLRMMEMYADLDNSEKADEYLHYGSQKSHGSRGSSGRRTPARTSSKDSFPTSIVIEPQNMNDSSMAA